MTQRIPLANGRGFALVDDADVPLVSGYRWCLNRPYPTRFYAMAHVPGGGGARIYMHTLITGKRGIDHANGDGLDNTRTNLRPATQAQNNANRSAQRGTASRFKGIYQDKRRGHWVARIRLNGRQRYLGSFATEEAAAYVYDAAALALWGEYARLNFPR